MQYAEYQLKPGQKKNSKAKEKRERIRCGLSEFAIIFNYRRFINLFPDCDNLQNK